MKLIINRNMDSTLAQVPQRLAEVVKAADELGMIPYLTFHMDEVIGLCDGIKMVQSYNTIVETTVPNVKLAIRSLNRCIHLIRKACERRGMGKDCIFSEASFINL